MGQVLSLHQHMTVKVMQQGESERMEGKSFLLVSQALSFGLTQYDVEELKEHCDNRCRVPCLLSSSLQDPLVL